VPEAETIRRLTEDLIDCNERLETLTQQEKEAGDQSDQDTLDHVLQQVSDLLDHKTDLETTIVTMGDFAAHGMLEMLEAAGFENPQDVRVKILVELWERPEREAFWQSLLDESQKGEIAQTIGKVEDPAEFRRRLEAVIACRKAMTRAKFSSQESCKSQSPCPEHQIYYR